MKKISGLLFIMCSIFSATAQKNFPPAGTANTSLSNLKATAVNVNLLPDSNNFRNLGNATHDWKNFYFDGTVYSLGHKFISTNGTDFNSVFMGDMAGNVNATYGNVGFGPQALMATATGFGNTGIGSQPLYSNTSGTENTALGYLTLFSNTTGIQNVAAGAYALQSNTIGNYNSAVGLNALLNNTTGDHNTANGYQSLFSNINGGYNTANGYEALYTNTSGVFNTAGGFQALYNSTGGYNTSLGVAALYNNTTGNYNTCLGAYANIPAGSTFDNATAIGSKAIATAGNQVRIGDNSVTSIGGYANWTNVSDGRVKKNIKPNVPGLAFINKLLPVTYNLDLDAVDKITQSPDIKDKDGKPVPPSPAETEARKQKEQIVYTGFIAQDVEKTAKSLNYDFSGVDAAKNSKDLYGLRYSDFVVPLVKAVQELSKQNDSLKMNYDAKIDAMQNQINDLKAMILGNASTGNRQPSTSLSSASLEQNTPNPFSSATTIHYALPQKFSSAQIIITDKSGNILKQINVTGAGKGSANIDAATLSAGAYNYALYVDGKLAGTKQMILAK